MPAHVPPIADEREGLLAYLAQQRQTLRATTHGLSDNQARMTPTASELSIGGLIKHAARCEAGWTDLILQRRRGRQRTADEGDSAEFVLTADETLADVLDQYEAAARETDAVVAEIVDLGQAVPVPQGLPWFPADVKNWSVRWVLLHLIEETSRHGGHADIIRETIDGATLFPLLAAAEQWPDPWFQPWQGPAERTA
ncbi:MULTISPECIES: DinB family protein [unclassified Streptomyces]|uniref:DinB family protein n=1 Tax=unclassified Streptomyces TaxID=2593676 RepID=UPI003630C6C0